MFSLPVLALLLAALPMPPASRAAPVRTLTITARNYAYELPDTVAAGRTEVRLLNKGTELHHASLIRLDGGHTLSELMAAMKAGGPPPAWAKEVGGPNTPVPGGTSSAVLDLKAGNYAIVCFIPSPDGQAHVMKGMIKGFTAADAAHLKATAPASAVAAPDVTLTLTDYTFTFSRPLSAGRHVLRIVNDAAQVHEMFIVRLAPGKTSQDVAAWTEKMQGPPPGQPLGGIAGMAKGEVNDIPLDLAPGTYGLLCFVPDAKDGKPHIMHGMLKDIVVK